MTSTIDRYELFHVRIPFTTAFAHASHERRESDALLVSLHAGDLVGWGEIQPRPYVTGETIDLVKSSLAAEVAERVVGRSFDSLEDVARWVPAEADARGRSLATFGGFEIALLDLVGRATGRSAGAFLGPAAVESLPAGVIIGFDVATEDLAKHCAMLRFKRRTHLKVKVGRDDDDERLSIIAAKTKVPLRLDANEAWTADVTIDRLRSLEGVTVASIEQPVPAADLEGLAKIRAAGFSVMADESLVSLADAEALVAAKAADVFNVRLGKHGGLVNAARIVGFAKTNGVSVHLGTMVGETGVLTRATEIFATRVAGFACLDGKGQNLHLSADDVATPRAKPFETPPDAPGLGVSVAPEKLREYVLDHDSRDH
jgi:muconate cycloisomerase